MKREQQAQHPAREPPVPEERHNGDAAAPGTPASEPKPEGPAEATKPELTEREALQLLLKQFQELREYLLYYAAAKTDGVKYAVRNVIRQIVLAALGFVVVAGLIVMATWFVLSGLARGLGASFGNQAWIGPVITGALTLAGVGLGISCVVLIQKSASRNRMVQKYETRHAQQRARFGRDVHN
jgi:hypothetical protein